MLPALKAKKNLTLTIHGNNKLQFTKVAIGEVWLASGQSNMAFKMGQVKSMFPEEMIIDNALDIRQFYIDTDYNYKTPQSDFDKATWQLTNHKTIKDFSAVAWFFAKEIAQKQGVTVGILNASVGNTQVQSWMSEKALKAFPKDLKHGLLFRDDHYIKLKENELKQKEQIKQNWLNENKIKDKGLNAKVPWSDDIAVSDWHELRMPDQLQYQNIDFQSGIFWMKKTVQLTSLQAKQNARLILGLMNDIDTTYINGIKVGSTNSPWKLRDYKIPLQALRFGNNTITVRMTTLRINAGMVQTEPYQLEIGSDIIPLTGKWLYKVGVKSKKLPRPRPSSWHPMGHFNAMISPLLPFSLKGVIWYQGETNTPDLNN